VIYTDYLPRTADPHTAVTSSPVSEPKPSDKRLASCCDLDMRAVRYRAPVRSSGDVTFQVVAAAPRTAGATPSSHTEKKGHNWWPLVAALATAAALGLLLHRRRLRAREETQPPAV
jgi:hypothetical protein